MLVNAAIGVIGAAGISFYVLFLVGLSRERKSKIRCWVRLRVDSDPDETHELCEEKEILEEGLESAA